MEHLSDFKLVDNYYCIIKGEICFGDRFYFLIASIKAFEYSNSIVNFALVGRQLIRHPKAHMVLKQYYKTVFYSIKANLFDSHLYFVIWHHLLFQMNLANTFEHYF